MSEIFYFDAIDIKSTKSGAASIFYYENGFEKVINLTDAGYYSTHTDVAYHIKEYYGSDIVFNNVIVTHNDNDHAGGVKYILENYTVNALWMLRPWLYADELIDRFARYRSVKNLEQRLREIYSNLAVLEEIAEDNDIPIYEPFQGAIIGKSLVLAPSQTRFFDLIVESDKTPPPASDGLFSESSIVGKALEAIVAFVKSQWGDENFSAEDTTAENEMSVVQFISADSYTYLLTGDVGRQGLAEALDWLEGVCGGTLPRIGLLSSFGRVKTPSFSWQLQRDFSTS